MLAAGAVPSQLPKPISGWRVGIPNLATPTTRELIMHQTKQYLTWLVELVLPFSCETRAANQMEVLVTGATRPKRRKCLYLIETRERGNWTWWDKVLVSSNAMRESNRRTFPFTEPCRKKFRSLACVKKMTRRQRSSLLFILVVIGAMYEGKLRTLSLTIC